MSQRRFEFTDAKSHKFWIIDLDSSRHTVQFGRIGAAGQSQTKQFASEAEAESACEKLVQEKLKKGYVEVGATAGEPPASEPLIDRFRRLEHRCRAEGLIWPAEIVGEIVQQCEAYAGHDARFSPIRVAELVGELCIRCDAIRSDTGAVPQLFVRGASSDRVTEVGSARMVGLGCEARIRRGAVELAA